MHENTENKVKKHLPWVWVQSACSILANKIKEHHQGTEIAGVIAFPRGGLVPATLLAHQLDIGTVMTTSEFDSRVILDDSLMRGTYLLVDDISDTGGTISDWITGYVNHVDLWQIKFIVATLCYRPGTAYVPNYTIQNAYDNWIVFPWELN